MAVDVADVVLDDVDSRDGRFGQEGKAHELEPPPPKEDDEKELLRGVISRRSFAAVMSVDLDFFLAFLLRELVA